MDDLTNRIMAIAVAFLWIFAIFIVILLVWSAPDESITRIRDLAGYLDDHNTTEAQLIATFGGVILMLLAFLLILFELVPPATENLKVQKVGSGGGSISTDEVVRRLEEELQAVPNVYQVQVTIQGRGQKAEVSLSLDVAPEANLATTVEEACRQAAELLEGRMGIALAKPPQAEVHYRELHVGKSAPPAPVTPPSAPPESALVPETAPPAAIETESMDDSSQEGPRDDRTAGS